MGTIADIESRGGATVYRFSEASIRRGLDHGKTGDQIRSFLIKTSKTPMPQPLDYLITDVAKRHGKLRVGSAHTYIRCEDEGLVQQILHDKNCEHLRLRKIATQVLVTDLELTEVINELREFGYLPAAENASGVLLSQPNLRRAKSRPKPPRIISELTSPKEGIILSAVKAIRAGERSRKVEPIVSGTSSNETLALINQYISQKRTLIISYADNNGGVSNRIIEPISISLGTLTAISTARSITWLHAAKSSVGDSHSTKRWISNIALTGLSLPYFQKWEQLQILKVGVVQRFTVLVKLQLGEA